MAEATRSEVVELLDIPVEKPSGKRRDQFSPKTTPNFSEVTSEKEGTGLSDANLSNYSPENDEWRREQYEQEVNEVEEQHEQDEDEYLKIHQTNHERSKADVENRARKVVGETFASCRRKLTKENGLREIREKIIPLLVPYIGDGVLVDFGTDRDGAKEGEQVEGDERLEYEASPKLNVFSKLGMKPLSQRAIRSDMVDPRRVDPSERQHLIGTVPAEYDPPNNAVVVIPGDMAGPLYGHILDTKDLPLRTIAWLRKAKFQDQPWTWEMHRKCDAQLCDYLHSGISVTTLFSSGAARNYEMLTEWFHMVPMDLTIDQHLFNASHLVQFYQVNIRRLAIDFNLTPYMMMVEMGLSPGTMATLGVTWQGLLRWKTKRSGNPGGMTREMFLSACRNHPNKYRVESWRVSFGITYRDLGELGVTARDAWMLWHNDYTTPKKMYNHLGLENHKKCDSERFVAKLPKRQRMHQVVSGDNIPEKEEEAEGLPGLLSMFTSVFKNEDEDDSDEDLEDAWNPRRRRRSGHNHSYIHQTRSREKRPKQLRRRR